MASRGFPPLLALEVSKRGRPATNRCKSAGADLADEHRELALGAPRIPFIAMQIGLQEEKRAAQRVWAKREKQLEQVLTNTSGMYGELQALIALPDIPALTAGAEEAGCSEEPYRVVVKLPARARRDSEREELPL
jgi:hypothetical protein